MTHGHIHISKIIQLLILSQKKKELFMVPKQKRLSEPPQSGSMWVYRRVTPFCVSLVLGVPSFRLSPGKLTVGAPDAHGSFSKSVWSLNRNQKGTVAILGNHYFEQPHIYPMQKFNPKRISAAARLPSLVFASRLSRHPDAFCSTVPCLCCCAFDLAHLKQPCVHRLPLRQRMHILALLVSALSQNLGFASGSRRRLFSFCFRLTVPLLSPQVGLELLLSAGASKPLDSVRTCKRSAWLR